MAASLASLIPLQSFICMYWLQMGLNFFRRWIDPELPAPLREEFSLLSARHLRGQSRLLFIGFILSLPMVIAARVEAAPAWIGIGLPVVIFLLSSFGLWAVRERPTTVRNALSLMRQAWIAVLAVAAVGSLWGIGSWVYAPPETGIYYVAILSIGALTLGYTLTATRLVGLSALLITLVPISIALLTTGNLLDATLAVGLLIATGFQMLMLGRQQRLLIDLVQERKHSLELARLDPLTGLANRRALLEDAERLGQKGEPLCFFLIDIDRFKSVNDRYGHDTGDEVLMIVATIVAKRERREIRASRLGGEEFGLLGPVSLLSREHAEDILSEIRHAEMPHGHPLTVSIGMATGHIGRAGDWSMLYGNADEALYAAKHAGRNRVYEWEAFSKKSAPGRKAFVGA